MGEVFFFLQENRKFPFFSFTLATDFYFKWKQLNHKGGEKKILVYEKIKREKKIECITSFMN